MFLNAEILEFNSQNRLGPGLSNPCLERNSGTTEAK